MKNLCPASVPPTPRWVKFRPHGTPPPAAGQERDAAKRLPRRHLTIIFRA